MERKVLHAKLSNALCGARVDELKELWARIQPPEEPENKEEKAKWIQACTKAEELRSYWKTIAELYIDSIMARGNQEIVEFLWDTEVRPVNARCAVRHGHLRLLKWSWDHNVRVTNSDEAVAGAHTHVLDWLLSKDIRPTNAAADSAASAGNTIALQWLKKNGYKPSRNGEMLAAAFGHVLQ